MTLDLYSTGHQAFCRSPLHPGPCKGWKGTVRSTSKNIRAKADAGVKHVSPVKSNKEIGKPSRYGQVPYAVAPAVMQKDWEGHWDSLSTKQRDAVDEYSGGGYADMNNILRNPPDNPDEIDQEYIDQAALVQSAMAPAPRATKAFRGMYANGLGISKNPSLEEIQGLIGHTLVNDAFTSTSVDRKASFNGNVRLEIEVPKGTPSIYLGTNSQFPKESELLLAAGAKMKIVGVEEIPEDPGSYRVKVRVVP